MREREKQNTVLWQELVSTVGSQNDKLQYGTHELQISVRIDTQGTSTYTVQSTRAALDGYDELRFLRSIAPDGANDTPGQVLADWQLPSQAGGREGSYSQRLMAMHTRFGSAWDWFMRSRTAFTDVLQQAEKPLIGTNRESVYQVVHEEAFGVQSVARELIARQKQNEPVAEWLRVYGVPLSDKRYAGNKLGLRAQQQAVAKQIGSLHSNVRRALIRTARQDFCIPIIDEDTNETLLLPGHSPLSAQQTEQSSLREQACIDGEWHTVLVPAGVALQRRRIAPLLQWKKCGDTRRFVTEAPVITYVEGAKVYRDRLLGALLVAYTSPDIRAGWARSIEGRAYKQYRDQAMGAAQVPVLAVLDNMVLPGDPHRTPYRQRLLQAEFIRRAEQLANQSQR